MLKKILILGVCLFSTAVFAQSCGKLDAQATSRSDKLVPPWGMSVVGKKGFRTYFHTAPNEQCKNRELFLIPKDSVTAYNTITIKGQEWISVMYMRKNNDVVYGWMKASDFKYTGTMGLTYN